MAPSLPIGAPLSADAHSGCCRRALYSVTQLRLASRPGPLGCPHARVISIFGTLLGLGRSSKLVQGPACVCPGKNLAAGEHELSTLGATVTASRVTGPEMQELKSHIEAYEVNQGSRFSDVEDTVECVSSESSGSVWDRAR